MDIIILEPLIVHILQKTFSFLKLLSPLPHGVQVKHRGL